MQCFPFPHRAMPCALICISPAVLLLCKINGSVQSVFNKCWHVPWGDLASSILLGIDRGVQSLLREQKRNHIISVNKWIPTVQQASSRSGAVIHCRTLKQLGKAWIQYTSPVAGPQVIPAECWLLGNVLRIILSVLKIFKIFFPTSVEVLLTLTVLAQSRGHGFCSVATGCLVHSYLFHNLPEVWTPSSWNFWCLTNQIFNEIFSWTKHCAGAKH